MLAHDTQTPTTPRPALPPTNGEQSFRVVWANVMSTAIRDEDRIQHLKAELRSWVIGARGQSRGHALVFGATLDEEDEGLLSELNSIIVDAVRGKYELNRTITYLHCTALANGGLNL